MGLCRSSKNFVKIITNITFIFFIRCHCKPEIILHIYSYNIKFMFVKKRLTCLALSLGAKFLEVLRFDICCTPCKKVIFVSDQNCITSGIKKIMLDILCQVLFPLKYKPLNLSSRGLRPGETIWFKFCFFLGWYGHGLTKISHIVFKNKSYIVKKTVNTIVSIE